MSCKRVPRGFFSLWIAGVRLAELDHLGKCLGGKDWQEVGGQQILVSFTISCGRARLKPHEADAFAVLGAATPPVDQRWVESVHVKMNIVYEETLTNSNIAILIRLHVEFDLFRLQLAAIVDDDLFLVGDYAAHIPVFFRLQLG